MNDNIEATEVTPDDVLAPETLLSKAKRIGKRAILPAIAIGGAIGTAILISLSGRVDSLEDDVDDLFALEYDSSDDTSDDSDASESDD